jgi:hypothetical protein
MIRGNMDSSSSKSPGGRIEKKFYNKGCAILGTIGKEMEK